jgi:hypothetical protein
LDEDGFGQFLTDAEAGIAYLANQTAIATEKLDGLFLTKPHLPEAIHDFLGGGERLDAYDCSCRNPA